MASRMIHLAAMTYANHRFAYAIDQIGSLRYLNMGAGFGSAQFNFGVWLREREQGRRLPPVRRLLLPRVSIPPG